MSQLNIANDNILTNLTINFVAYGFIYSLLILTISHKFIKNIKSH